MTKKIVKLILLAIGILIVALTTLYMLVMKGVVPIDFSPGARTMYTGYVHIEPVSLSDIKTQLEKQGCHTINHDPETIDSCFYQETNIYYENKNGFVIYPHGQGFGPISFSLTEDTLWDNKDILGPPRSSAFKEAVRQDVQAIGNIVKIKENSWKITEMEYPWTAIY